MKYTDYEDVNAFVVPMYRYIEGKSKEEWWVDSQNCMYYTFQETDKEFDLINGRKWWLISPMKPKGTVITKDNRNLIKWIVDFSSEDDDMDKEWDFKNHKPIE